MFKKDTSKLSIQILSLLVIGMALSSCVTSVNPEKTLGVKSGDKLKTTARSKLVSGDISGWTSTLDTWFGSSSNKIELKPLSEGNFYGKDIGRIPIGHEVEIRKVKRYSWNHNVVVMAKLEKNGIVYKVVIPSRNMDVLFGGEQIKQ